MKDVIHEAAAMRQTYVDMKTDIILTYYSILSCFITLSITVFSFLWPTCTDMAESKAASTHMHRYVPKQMNIKRFQGLGVYGKDKENR